MPTEQPALTPAALMYLFADRVIEPDTALSTKFVVPCTEAAVKRKPLAGHLFAISFWSLQEQGKLMLSMGKRTMLGLGRQQISAVLQPGTTVRTPPAAAQITVDLSQLAQAGGLAGGIGKMLEGLGQNIPGRAAGTSAEPGSPPFTLEDATLYQLQAAGSTAPVRDVIRDWFGTDESDPHGSVIDRAAVEIGDLGYATGIEQGSMWSSPTLKIDCERRAELEGSATEVLERWRAYRDAPDGLGSTLVDRCRAAISSRTEGDDSD